MAFNDNPIIDDNAHLSEESVNAVKAAFTSKRGFRCRDQYPDNGVDQNVELLNERSEATGKLFGIQIKSTKSIKKIDIEDNQYLVWQFKTSRLGYLTRYAPPGYGLVVIYIEENEKCYFDFVDEITARLNRIHPNDTWENQQTVNIHIPLSNEVTPESIALIYSKLTQRFKRHELFLSQHGKSFDLPFTINKFPQTNKFPLEELELGIIYLIERHEFSKICRLISPYRHFEIGQFKTVCLFGTYAWMEVGHVYEAKSLLMRCKRFEPEFNDFEKEVYVMTKHRLAWLSGDISLQEFGQEMEIELAKFKNPTNIVGIRLNLFFLKVSALDTLDVIDRELGVDLKLFFNEIKKLEISEKGKYILILQLCEIVSGYMNILLTRFILIMNIRKNIGGPIQEEGHELADRINDMGQIVYEHIMSAVEYGSRSEEKLIYATALYRKAKHFLHTQFILALQGDASPWTVELKTDYLRGFAEFVNYYNANLEEEHYYDAYLALHHAVDIILLYRLLYKQELRDKNGEDLIEIAKKMENQFGFKPYKSQIEEGMRVTNHQRDNPSIIKLANATDAQLLMMAKQIQVSQRLQVDKLTNILSELQTYRRFDQVCNNPNIELLTELPITQHLYDRPQKYKLRSIPTGLETPLSKDIEHLMEMFHHLMNIR